MCKCHTKRILWGRVGRVVQGGAGWGRACNAEVKVWDRFGTDLAKNGFDGVM
jgi:hypothetical protein